MCGDGSVFRSCRRAQGGCAQMILSSYTSQFVRGPRSLCSFGRRFVGDSQLSKLSIVRGVLCMYYRCVVMRAIHSFVLHCSNKNQSAAEFQRFQMTKQRCWKLHKSNVPTNSFVKYLMLRSWIYFEICSTYVILPYLGSIIVLFYQHATMIHLARTTTSCHQFKFSCATINAYITMNSTINCDSKK